MDEVEKFKEEILKEYPRLKKESEFTFNCGPDVSCFNDCCRDVNIFLTPYDILRLKRSLGIESGEFLEKYTFLPFDENSRYPVIILKMSDDEEKKCPFVTEEGCSVYTSRPWACRMFPLGLASPKDDVPHSDEEFYFLLIEDICKGHNENKKITVREWMTDQGIDEYNEAGRYFKDISLNSFFEDEKNLTPEKLDMFHMVCYDIDRFRRLIFNSSFFEKFDVDEDLRIVIEKDDYELMNFGYIWLKFALFGEKTVKVKTDMLEAKKEQLKKEGK